MKALRRWKRKYKKLHAFLSSHPMDAVHKKTDAVHSKRNTNAPQLVGGTKDPWTHASLANASKYPQPTWTTLDDGSLVYGPVREDEGWIFVNKEGKTVYSKADRRRELQEKYDPNRTGLQTTKKTPAKKTRPTMCGKKRADGKKCRFKGECPHHKDHMW